MRPTELHILIVSWLSKVRQGSDLVSYIKGRIGSIDGTDRTYRGGFKGVKIKPKQILMWDEDLMDGRANIYREIKEYI